MKMCKSAYVLKIFESYTNKICKVLVMEYCNGATIEHYIKRKGRFKEQDAIMVLKEIIFGLAVRILINRKCIGTESSIGT